MPALSLPTGRVDQKPDQKPDQKRGELTLGLVGMLNHRLQLNHQRAETVPRAAIDNREQVSHLQEQPRVMAAGLEALEGVITHLVGRASEIDRIVDLISDIARKSNLLALNAAIEAARLADDVRAVLLYIFRPPTLR